MKTQAQMSYVCATYSWFNIPIYCMVIDVERGGGSNAYASQWVSYSGDLVTLSKACLENDGNHRKVNFKHDSKHYAKNIYGGTIWTVTHSPFASYLSNEGTCAQWGEDKNFNSGGYYAYTESHLRYYNNGDRLNHCH